MWRPKDGSVIAIFAHTAPFEPLLGKGTGRFDATQIHLDRQHGRGRRRLRRLGACRHLASSTICSPRDSVRSGGAGTGGPLTQFPTAVARLLGAKIKLIQGYKGSAEIRLAMARGELQGVCGIPMSTLKTEWRDDFNSGRFKVILQLGRDA